MTRTAGVVLQFGPGVRAACTALLAAAAVALLLVARHRGGEALPLKGFLAVAVLLLGAATVEVHGVAHRLVPGGVERVAPARGRVTVRWSEVSSVEWGARTGWYEIRRRDGEVVRVYSQLTNLGAFARAALEGIPAQILDARPAVRARLEQLARGERPADEPDREEWRPH